METSNRKCAWYLKEGEIVLIEGEARKIIRIRQINTCLCNRRKVSIVFEGDKNIYFYPKDRMLEVIG